VNQFDIKLESHAQPGHRGVADEILLVAKAREQQLRDLAGPFLRAGYLPGELVAVERQSKWFTHDYMYESVSIVRHRSALRLWCRRMMFRLHRRPYSWQG
jgi:hypothetical protein